jgi:hypothetical protein
VVEKKLGIWYNDEGEMAVSSHLVDNIVDKLVVFLGVSLWKPVDCVDNFCV